MTRIGIDLGGTKIEGVRLDGDDTVAARERIATPRDDYQATLEAVRDLVVQLEDGAGPHPVGVGHPGTISPASGRVKNANSTWLNGQPLRSDLADLLPDRPLQLANDADCFALSEATDGAGAGARSVFGVILGTGVGGGIVFEGRRHTGPNAIAGEWGHNPLPWSRDEEHPGPRCWCRKQGCIETFLSGPGLAEDHRQVTGEELSPEGIVEAAANRVLDAETTLRRHQHRVARALASVVNLLDPEVIVLGGGLSNLQGLYRNVPMLWREFIFSDDVTTRLEPPRHGDSSGVLGAARLHAAR